jgi:hypothetical protein
VDKTIAFLLRREWSTRARSEQVHVIADARWAVGSVAADRVTFAPGTAADYAKTAST